MTDNEIMNPRFAHAIKNIVDNYKILVEAKITDEKEYPLAAAVFLDAVTLLAQHHRNWNPVLGEPDGLYDYEFEDKLPEGWRKPVVDYPDLNNLEEMINEIFYKAATAKLKKPTISTLSMMDSLGNDIYNLSTFHPNYNEDTMRIEK